MPALDLTSTYLHLGEGPAVWEMHPEGDEVIVVLSGSVTFHFDDGHFDDGHFDDGHLDDGTSTWSVAVTAPHCVVVPKGTWHTADVPEPGQILVITWGEGTQHRPRD